MIKNRDKLFNKMKRLNKRVNKKNNMIQKKNKMKKIVSVHLMNKMTVLKRTKMNKKLTKTTKKINLMIYFTSKRQRT